MHDELDAIEPALCAVAESPPEGDGWIHEPKLDGYRALCRLRDGRARIRTRTGVDYTQHFAGIARAVEALPARSALLDGEIVALDTLGRPDFGALADGRGTPLFYAFDLLHLDGEDLRPRPLLARKERLATLLAGASPGIRALDHVVGDGARFFHHACELGLEGSVSKRADAPYPRGRTRAWLKNRCVRRERFVVVGFTDPSGARSDFGALLLARREGERLRYVGKVGTGFTERTLAAVRARLRERELPPLEGAEGRGVHWVEPALEVEVEYRDWTSDQKLRFASFRSMVEPVRFTHPDRVLWPGVTKRDYARYLERVAERMLRHVAGRPLTLFRCPDGEHARGFFQRHRVEGLPEALRATKVPGHDEPYIWIEDVSGLLATAQIGALEVHPWGARIDAPDLPDRLIFDLDPDPALPWADVASAAQRVRERLAALGLRSWVKLTGGKGLHVVLPIRRGVDWGSAKRFCRAVADAIATEEPRRYTTRMTKAERVGRVYIDTLRNDPGSTAIGPWSPRARPGAPVAAPLRWEELDGPRPVRTLATVDDGDPWEDFEEQGLPT